MADIVVRLQRLEGLLVALKDEVATPRLAPAPKTQRGKRSMAIRQYI
jgi:hypothetical protein